MELPPKRKKGGCLKLIVVLLLLYGVTKGCTAYQNRPTALYERWFGEPVPEDVTNLDGVFKFQLTESIAILNFSAPPERIAQIVAARGMTLVVPDIPWDQKVASQTREITVGDYTGSETWFARKEPYPNGQQIYWVNSNSESKSDFILNGWALYYNTFTREAHYTLHTT